MIFRTLGRPGVASELLTSAEPFSPSYGQGEGLLSQGKAGPLLRSSELL